MDIEYDAVVMACLTCGSGASLSSASRDVLDWCCHHGWLYQTRLIAVDPGSSPRSERFSTVSYAGECTKWQMSGIYMV